MSDSKTGSADGELEAIGTVLRALESLEGDSIQRVLDYVVRRLGISRPLGFAPDASIETATSPVGLTTARQPSIRDLKELKKPESDNQMAALVAYYLSEVATPDEQKQTIATSDLEKLFKQAGFRLPKRISMTLPNAATAGYLDPMGNGTYKLNPVGYNLVAHALPRDHSLAPQPRRKPKKKSARR